MENNDDNYGSYSNDVNDENPGKLNMNTRRKYAKINRCFELGIWSSDEGCMFPIVLSTAEKSVLNDRKRRKRNHNTWKQLKNDNRQLKLAMKRLGFDYEYCLCPELTPGKRLLHLHGLIRVKNDVKMADFFKALSENWMILHGSPVVWIGEVYNMKNLIRYNTKDAIKNYLSERFEFGYVSPRLLKSRKWLPSGWKKAQKIFVSWALTKRDWMLEDQKFYSPEAVDREYVFDKWGCVSEYLRKWCQGEQIKIVIDGVFYIVDRENVYEGVLDDD